MKPFTVGALFSGIGGMELGLESTGFFETKWFSEIQPYSIQIMEQRFPGAYNIGDIKNVKWNEIEKVDVLTGGFPCQDISNAGKRKGIEGKRSGLWKEYVKSISCIRPKYVIVENVSALRRRGLDRVLGDLVSLGYDCEWNCIPAANIGANHLRDRIFIIAYPHTDCDRCHTDRRNEKCDEEITESGSEPEHLYPEIPYPTGKRLLNRNNSGGERQILLEGEKFEKNKPKGQRGECGIDKNSNDATDEVGYVSDTYHTGNWKLELLRECYHTNRKEIWEIEPDVGRMVDGVPKELDIATRKKMNSIWKARIEALGNAVVPQCAEYIGYLIISREILLQRSCNLL